MSIPPLILVRVQDDLHGAFMDEAGLRLPFRRKDSQRNTIHFSLNCLVEDHAYGKFNFRDGQFTGKVVILADPRELVPAAGLGQVDTWYRLDTIHHKADDSFVRSLSVGKATVIAPKGTLLAPGVNAIFYEGGYSARNHAVAEFFEQHNAPLHTASMRGWSGVPEQEAMQWARQQAHAIFGPAGDRIYVGPHAGSMDEQMESAGVQGLVATLRQERFTDDDSGCSQSNLDRIEKKAVASIALLERFLQDISPEEKSRIGLHYKKQIQIIFTELVEARSLDAQHEALEVRAFTKRVSLGLQAMPGQGNFFLSKKENDQAYDSFDHDAFAAMIAGDGVSFKQKLWRAGMLNDWKEVRATAVGEMMVGLGCRPGDDAHRSASEVPSLMVKAEATYTKAQQDQMEMLRFLSKQPQVALSEPMTQSPTC